MQTHSGPLHMCPVCGLYLKTKKGLKIHNINHSRDTEVKVEHSKELIATAVQKVLNGSAVLKVAEAMNVSYGSLTRWVNLVKQENACNICGNSFSFGSELDKHIENKHNDEKPPSEKRRKSNKEFKATVLEYLKTNGKSATINEFKISESTLRSWSVMDKKPLRCPTCDFSAPSKSKFERHMCRFDHEQTRPCTFCDLSLTSGQKLRKHMRRVHNLPERSSHKRNELREFLKNMNTPEPCKVDAKLSEAKIPPKSPEQIKALNNILKGYTGADLIDILKRVQPMEELDIEQFLESHVKAKSLAKEVKVEDRRVAEMIIEDIEVDIGDWDFKELKKEDSTVEGKSFWPVKEIQMATAKEIHLDTEIVQEEKKAKVKGTFENSESNEINESKIVTDIQDVKLEKIAAETTVETCVSAAEKVGLKVCDVGSQDASQRFDSKRVSQYFDEDEMSKMRKKLEEMKKNMRMMEAMMERHKQKAFANKENKGDENTADLNKECFYKVGKEMQKKPQEMLDGNNEPNEEVNLKDGEEVDLKAIFSFKESEGKVKQKNETRKRGPERNPLIGTLCKHCGQLLTRDFERHLARHTGLRNYMCTYCSKTFILKSHLARHIRVLHIDGDVPVKVYECERCNFKYRKPKSLALHNKVAALLD